MTECADEDDGHLDDLVGDVFGDFGLKLAADARFGLRGKNIGLLHAVDGS